MAQGRYDDLLRQADALLATAPAVDPRDRYKDLLAEADAMLGAAPDASRLEAPPPVQASAVPDPSASTPRRTRVAQPGDMLAHLRDIFGRSTTASLSGVTLGAAGGALRWGANAIPSALGGSTGQAAALLTGEALSRADASVQDLMRPPEDLLVDVLEQPGVLTDPRWWAMGAGQAAGSVIGFYVPGGTVARGVGLAGRALAWSRRAAQLLERAGFVAGGTGFEAMTEGALAFNEAVDAGKTPDEAGAIAAGVAAKNAALIGATAGVGYGIPGGRSVARTLAQMVLEGGQEAGQEAISNMAMGRPAGEGAANAAIIGALAGGGIGALADASSSDAADPPARKPPLRDAQLPVPTRFGSYAARDEQIQATLRAADEMLAANAPAATVDTGVPGITENGNALDIPAIARQADELLAANDAVDTSQAPAFRRRMFQGRGATPEQVYGKDAVAQGRAVPLFGQADYFASTREDATRYGEVREHDVELRKPFVLDSDRSWFQLLKDADAGHLDNMSAAFYEEPGQIPAATERLQTYLRQQGYDGIIVELDREGDRTKRLHAMAGHDQVVRFAPPARAADPVADDPVVTAVSEPVPSKFSDLPVHQRREMLRILSELESYQYEGHTFNEIPRGAGGSFDVVGGHGGVPVLQDILQGRSGSRQQVERAIRRFVREGAKPSTYARDALRVARMRLVGDNSVTKAWGRDDAGDEPGQIYVRRTRQGTPDAAVEAAVADKLEADPAGYKQRYRERFGNVLNADNASELFEEYAATPETRAENMRAVRSSAGALVDALFSDMVQEPVAEGRHPVVVFLAGGTGSGKSTLGRTHPYPSGAHVVLDSTLADYDATLKNITRALFRGLEVSVLAVNRDPREAWQGVLERASGVEGRSVPVATHARSHRNAARNVLRLADEFANDPRVEISVFENVAGRAFEGRDLAWLAERAGVYNEVDVLEAQLRDDLQRARAEGRIDERVVRASDPAAAAELPAADAAVDRRAVPEAAEGLSGTGRPAEPRDRGVSRESEDEDAERSPREVSPRRRPRNPIIPAPRESQPSLPGTEGVRDVENSTPEFELPFSLTPSKAPAKKDDTGTLFEGVDRSVTAGSRTRRPFFEPPKPGAAGRSAVLPLPKGEYVKPSELATRIKARFGRIPIASGRVPRGAHGIYKIKAQAIRLRVANDLATIAHELGHHVDRALFGAALPHELYVQELETLGRQTSPPNAKPSYLRKEGAAEFFRLWVSDPVEAERQAPKYYAAFTAAVDANPTVGAPLLETQADIQAYLAQDMATRGEARIDFDGGEESTVRQALREPRAWLEQQAINWVDDLSALKRVTEALGDTNGQPIDFAESGYVLARLARGAADKARGFLHYGVRRRDGQFMGGSLAQALEPVKGRYREFGRYLVALRVPELLRRGVETGMTAAEAKAIAEKYHSPEFEQAREAAYKFQDAVLHYARESGAISADQIAEMRQLNQHYVPFQRVFDAASTAAGGRSVANRKAPIYRIKGSGRDIINPLESIVRNTFRMVEEVEQNFAMLKFADQIQETPGSGRYMERVPPAMEATSFNLQQVAGTIKRQLDEAGVELPDNLDFDALATVFMPATFTVRGSSYVRVMRAGKPEFYQVHDKALLEAIEVVGPQNAAVIYGIFMRPVAWLRAGATLTLGFIARNPVRDTFSAGIQSRYGFVPVIDTVRGLYSYLRADEYYQQFLNSGAASASFWSQDRSKLREELRRVEGKTTIRTPIEALRGLSEATEMATRLGEFRLAVKKEGATQEGFARAALAARDVTLDFSRAGRHGRTVNSIYAFFNARLQGYARMVELAKQDARELAKGRDAAKNPMHYASGRAAVYISTLSMLLWALNKDDDEYRELPEWERNTYWHVPLGAGKGWVRIPKPFEWGTIYGNGIEAALDFLYDKAPEKINEGLIPAGFSLNGLVGMLVPTIALPVTEWAANWSFFRQRPIVSPYDKGLPADLQYNRWTSETAIALADVFNATVGGATVLPGRRVPEISPAMIDHLVFGYFAGLGRSVMNGPGAVQRAVGLSLDPAPTKEDWPVVGTFYRRRGNYASAESLQDLYDAAELLKDVGRAQRLYLEDGKPEKAAALATRVRDLAPRRPAINRAVTDLRELRSSIDRIYRDRTMGADKKRQQLDAVYERMVDVARAALGKPPLTKEAAGE